MAATIDLSYRTVDECIDAVRIDLKSFESAGDIDTADLIQIAQEINYELGLKIHTLKETMLEVDHHQVKLPSDFYQALLTLICHEHRFVKQAPWNGNVLLEEVYSDTRTRDTICDICNVTHEGDCPNIVVNPYPLGKTRTLCNGNVGIRILHYCESEIRCFERFEQLFLKPHITASGFTQQNRYYDEYNVGSISGKFLYTPGIECGKVYLYYTGAMEDAGGHLLVLDHPKINQYYQWAMKYHILSHLYLNGEDLIQRVQFAEKQVEKYKDMALSIANMPDYRQVLKSISTIKKNHDRQYYHPISRWFGHLGWSIPVDNL